MHGIGIGRGMDGDRADPHFMAGAMDAQRDLAAICDQDLFEHRSSVLPQKFVCEFLG